MQQNTPDFVPGADHGPPAPPGAAAQGWAPAAPPTPYGPQPAPSRHSRLGIASFVLAVLNGLFMFALIAAVGIIEIRTPGGMDEESPTAITIGVLFILGGFLCLAGLGLGVAGLFDGNRKRVFSLLGLTFNALMILGVLGLVVLGLAGS